MFNGLLIKLCGQHGTGKTTYSNIIYKQFKKCGVVHSMIINIEWKIIMCNASAKFLDKNAIEIIECPKSKLYARLYKCYKQNNLENQVNECIHDLIVKNKNKIIILDSHNNYYYKETLFDSSVLTMLRINIYIIKCVKPLLKKVESFGNRNAISWLPSNINLNKLTSCSTNKKLLLHGKTQPHLTYQICWKDFSDCGKNIMLEAIDNISYQFTHGDLEIYGKYI